VFHVTSGSAPRDYTVGAGEAITGTWPAPAGEDIRVHGPNGFYREFAGEGPDITASPARGELELAITSPGAARLAGHIETGRPSVSDPSLGVS
jgi:phospholipase C